MSDKKKDLNNLNFDSINDIRGSIQQTIEESKKPSFAKLSKLI